MRGAHELVEKEMCTWHLSKAVVRERGAWAYSPELAPAVSGEYPVSVLTIVVVLPVLVSYHTDTCSRARTVFLRQP